MNGRAVPDELLRDAPTCAPSAAELADLELLLSGAYAPLTGFLGARDLDSLARTGRLADGGSWPVPVTLEVPASVAATLDPDDPARRTIILTDHEGAPIATIDVTDLYPASGGAVGVGGPVHAYGDGRHGSFHRLRYSPEEIRRALPAGRVLGVIADRPLHRPQLAQITLAARKSVV